MRRILLILPLLLTLTACGDDGGIGGWGNTSSSSSTSSSVSSSSSSPSATTGGDDGSDDGGGDDCEDGYILVDGECVPDTGGDDGGGGSSSSSNSSAVACGSISDPNLNYELCADGECPAGRTCTATYDDSPMCACLVTGTTCYPECDSITERCINDICVPRNMICAGNSDCSDPTPICKPNPGICVECIMDSNCESNKYCSPGNTCLPRSCEEAIDCPSQPSLCVEGECQRVGCVDNSDCSNRNVWGGCEIPRSCMANNECGECDSDDDCPVLAIPRDPGADCSEYNAELQLDDYACRQGTCEIITR